MSVDASALVAILTEEEDWLRLQHAISTRKSALTSPIAIWETVVALVRINDVSLDHAEAVVERFVADNRIDIVPISPSVGVEARKAWYRYGKGRHPARLNLGDCFAYAAARKDGLALLFKGDDFVKTDIAVA